MTAQGRFASDNSADTNCRKYAFYFHVEVEFIILSYHASVHRADADRVETLEGFLY